MRRRDKDRLNSAGSFSLRYNLPYYFIKSTRRYMGDISEKAKLRLAFIEFYKTIKDVSLVCKTFKISRPTFYKWYHRYQPNNLKGLEDQLKTPKHKRITTLPWDKEIRIKKLREEHLCLGKDKLKRMYERKYGEPVSFNHIQYVIQKYKLYYDKEKAAKIRTKRLRNKGAKKIRINQVNPKDFLTKDKPFFFCVDAIVLYLSWGIKRYIFTAVDYFHKFSYAQVYKTKAAKNAFDFLLRLLVLTEGKIAAILMDNGSEFEKEFDAACKRLKITQIFTRVRTPKDNSINERFNRTLQEEFMGLDEYFEPSLAEDDLTRANKLLTEWLIFYNFQRPHQSLDYQTPMEYTTQRVLTMSPSSTAS